MDRYICLVGNYAPEDGQRGENVLEAELESREEEDKNPEKDMKTIVKRKYIYLRPIPIRDVLDGLVVSYVVPPNSPYLGIARTDIHKGQERYPKPEGGIEVVRAWVENPKKRCPK